MESKLGKRQIVVYLNDKETITYRREELLTVTIMGFVGIVLNSSNKSCTERT